MRSITNTDIIENRSKWARRIAPVTMVLLVGGLVTNLMSINQPALFQWTLLLLGAGFVSAIISSHLVNNWVREPRADQVLEKTLKKFGNDFILFNYTTDPKHVLVTPARIYAITVKHQDGTIIFNGKRFFRKWTWRRLFRLLADEGLGNPLGEAERAANQLRKTLDTAFDEEDMPAVEPLIVFSNPTVELKIEDPPVPILTPSQLKTYLRDHDRTSHISAQQRRTLTELLGGEWQED